MSNIVLPDDWGDFTCREAYEFPPIAVPRGTSSQIKIYPRRYFEDWKRMGMVSDGAPHIDKFISAMQSVLYEPLLADIPRQRVYVWGARTVVSWQYVYQNFPKNHFRGHPKEPSSYQVVPFYRLQELCLGWSGLANTIVPKNSTGALMFLGNDGITLPDPNRGRNTTVGKDRRLVGASHYATSYVKTWHLELPERHGDDRPCPDGMVFLTVGPC